MNLKKYPRTYHLPFSPEIHSDDKTITKEYLNNFINRRVIITEKLDGGNTLLKAGEVFARTHSSIANHPSFGPIKAMYSNIAHLIPEELLIFGENLYGIHSIEYDELDSFFYTFNMANNDIWLSWDDIKSNCQTFSLKHVPVVFDGQFSSIKEIEMLMIREAKQPSFLGKEREGFVIRIADSFPLDDFSNYAAKYVRRGHVQTNERWEVNWKAAKLKK